MKDLDLELKSEDKRQEKAKKKLYKYKEVFDSICYTPVPQRKQLTGISGSALTQANLDKTLLVKEFLTHFQNDQGKLFGEL